MAGNGLHVARVLSFWSANVSVSGNMSEALPVTLTCAKSSLSEAYQWLAQVLTSFAKAEQAIGHLCVRLDLSIKNGPLGSVDELRNRLIRAEHPRCRNLEKRISRWQSLRSVRHVLAHCTLQVVYDENRAPLFVTRHLPLDKDDVTPDRVWTANERSELFRLASNDARSIHDQVRNLLEDTKLIKELCKP